MLIIYLWTWAEDWGPMSSPNFFKLLGLVCNFIFFFLSTVRTVLKIYGYYSPQTPRWREPRELSCPVYGSYQLWGSLLECPHCSPVWFHFEILSFSFHYLVIGFQTSTASWSSLMQWLLWKGLSAMMVIKSLLLGWMEVDWLKKCVFTYIENIF